MATRITSKASKDFESIIKALQPQMQSIVEEVVMEPIKRQIQSAYELTFQNWKGGSADVESKSEKRKRYVIPEVKFEKPQVGIAITGKRIKAKIKIETTVIDGSGGPHELWYWLSYGTKSKTWDGETSAAFPPRSGNRTTPGTLKVGKVPVYETENGKIAYRRIKAGQTRTGIEERGWHKLIHREIELGNLDMPGWKISNVEDNNPV